MVYNRKTKGCKICYKSKVDPATGACRSIPKTDPCVLYENRKFQLKNKKRTIDFDYCHLCKEGYLYTIKDKKNFNLPICTEDPEFIQNCANEVRDTDESPKYCRTCHGGVPRFDRKKCKLWDNMVVPIKNCDIGIVITGPKYGCSLCKGDMIWDSTKKSCRMMRRQMGCLQAIPNQKGDFICHGCNVFGGYTMKSNGKCVKVIKERKNRKKKKRRKKKGSKNRGRKKVSDKQSADL